MFRFILKISLKNEPFFYSQFIPMHQLPHLHFTNIKLTIKI